MDDTDTAVMASIYLFLSADGVMNNENIELFNSFGKQYDDFVSVRSEIIDGCDQLKRSLILNKESDNDNLTKNAIRALISEIKYISHRNIAIWRLIDLYERYGKKSDRQKAIIDALPEFPGIYKVTCDEMRDTSRAYLDLQNTRPMLSKSEFDKSWQDMNDCINSLITLG